MAILRQGVLLVVMLCSTLVYLFISYVNHIIRKFVGLFHAPNAAARILEHQMRESLTYKEWLAHAHEMDRLLGNDLWKVDNTSHLYDFRMIQARLYHLRQARQRRDFQRIMLLLRENLERGIGGIGNPQLYSRCLVGTKQLIHDYIDEVVEHIKLLETSDIPDLALEDKEQYLADARQAFGRSALLLSGGASMGMYHWGVVKCLRKNDALPPVICGASIGALIASLLGAHTDEELDELFDDPKAINFSVFEKRDPRGAGKRKLVRLLKHGVLMDIRTMEDFCRSNLPDMTFQEAYKKTGRIINIVLTHTCLGKNIPTLLNHLTTPNLLLWSAACAACTQPGLYAPVPLMGKDFLGKIVPMFPCSEAELMKSNNDLPMERLSELFNVNHFIVSQVNPHITPFLRSINSSSRFTFLHQAAMLLAGELLHLARQIAELGFFPSSLSWIKNEMTQVVEGHITIVPHLSIKAFKRAFRNPTGADFIIATNRGLQSTFPYVSMVQTCCKIENQLHRSLQSLRKNKGLKQKSSPLSATRPRSASLRGRPANVEDIPFKRTPSNSSPSRPALHSPLPDHPANNPMFVPSKSLDSSPLSVPRLNPSQGVTPKDVQSFMSFLETMD